MQRQQEHDLCKGEPTANGYQHCLTLVEVIIQTDPKTMLLLPTMHDSLPRVFLLQLGRTSSNTAELFPEPHHERGEEQGST